MSQDKAVGFLKGMDMLPADFTANSKLLHVGGLASQAFRDGEPGPIVEKLMTLHFGRSINGIPVQGPGSKIIIDIGDGGEIVNFAKKWNAFKTVVQVVQPNDLTKKFEPTTKKSIGGMAEGDVKPRMKGRIKIAPMERVELTKSEYLNQDEVRKMIEATILKEWTTADKIEVNDVQLVYYDRSGDWIQPAYGVIITIHWGEESLEYLFHIPALRNPPEAIYEQVELKNPLEKVEAMKTGQFEFD
jgi:hypothetical protein